MYSGVPAVPAWVSAIGCERGGVGSGLVALIDDDELPDGIVASSAIRLRARTARKRSVQSGGTVGEIVPTDKIEDMMPSVVTMFAAMCGGGCGARVRRRGRLRLPRSNGRRRAGAPSLRNTSDQVRPSTPSSDSR
jgi:hypothetical protein